MSLSKSDGTCWHVAIRGGQLLVDLQPDEKMESIAKVKKIDAFLR